MRRSDIPLNERNCPGIENCETKQEGNEPCKGCKVKQNLNWMPRYQTTQYAALLAAYIETFNLSPDKLSWYDFEIYQAYLTARGEHQRQRIDDGGKS